MLKRGQSDFSASFAQSRHLVDHILSYRVALGHRSTFLPSYSLYLTNKFPNICHFWRYCTEKFFFLKVACGRYPAKFCMKCLSSFIIFRQMTYCNVQIPKDLASAKTTISVVHKNREPRIVVTRWHNFMSYCVIRLVGYYGIIALCNVRLIRAH